MRRQYIEVGQGFMIVYKITSLSSFEDAERLQRLVVHVKEDADVPICSCWKQV